MKDNYSINVANLCIKSMLYEVSVSPKPGLVDRNNSGAHSDMDYFTFLDSISVLYTYFYDCCLAGKGFTSTSYESLLKNIRPLGIKAEKDMFKATYNVNTHKGMIFSLGIISAAVGSLNINRIESKTLSNRIKKMTKGITYELKNNKNKKLTYGEKLYRKYGFTGIRGEVEKGFPTVLNYSLPILKELKKNNNYSKNTIMLHVLLYLMKYTEDGNVLGRHDIETLEYVRNEVDKIVQNGGALNKNNINKIKELDRIFIKKNISTGGAADLLAVTLVFYWLEEGGLLYEY